MGGADAIGPPAMVPPVTVGVATGRPSINAMRLRSLTQHLIFGNEPEPPARAAASPRRQADGSITEAAGGEAEATGSGIVRGRRVCDILEEAAQFEGGVPL
jgi:hypothetical protein